MSETSDQLVFPTQEPVSEKAANGKKKPPVLSSQTSDEEVLDSHVGFDDQDFLDDTSADEIASIDSDQSSILDNEDGEGKDSGYFDKLKSVFGDQ